MARVFQRDAIEALLHYSHDLLGDREDLELRETGIWVIAPPDWAKGVALMPAEIDVLVQHPHRDLSRPALPFPFTLNDFLAFEDCCNVFRARFESGPDLTLDVSVLDGVERRCALAGELLRALFELDGPTRSRELSKPERHAQEVLAALRSLGYEPKKLRPRPAGPTPWVKSELRDLIASGKLRMSVPVLDATWDQLRREERIMEQKD